MSLRGAFLLFVVVAAGAAASIPDSEVAALSDFYHATGGDNWFARDGWGDASADPCTWFGVTCVAGHVDGLFLSRNNLRGTIPESLSDLTMMTGIDWSVNKLTGALPRSFGTLTNLYAVSLRENELVGPLPFEKLVKMEFAHLDFNHFNGTLEPFKNCPKLKVLGLTDNSLSGEIPEEFKELNELQTLFLGGNKLSGSLPEMSMATLTAMDVGRNRLTGAIPARAILANPNLVELNAFSNALTGDLSDVPNHDSIVVIDVHKNAISGTLPGSMAEGMPKLDILHLQDNAISGVLPECFRDSTVTNIDLSGNPLLCPMPEWAADVGAKCRSWKLKVVEPSRLPLSGGSVTVRGSDFSAGLTGVSCRFGTTTAPATVTSSSTVKCVAPKVSTAGAVSVTLEYAGQQITENSVKFNYYGTGAKVVARKSYPPVSVVILGEQKCPDMASIESIFLPIVRDLGTDVVDLKLGFIAKHNSEYPTGFWSLHGQTEIIGNSLVLCATEHYGIVEALEYADCLTKNITKIPSNHAVCAKERGLDADKLHKCALGNEGMKLITDAVALSDKYNAVWSPTVWIEEELFCLWHTSPCKATKESDFGKAVCEAYKGPKPEACGKY